MSLDTSPMTPAEAREQLARLRISQNGFAKIIGVNPSTFRRWIDPNSGFPMPRAAQLLLRLLTPAQARRLIAALET